MRILSPSKLAGVAEASRAMLLHVTDCTLYRNVCTYVLRVHIQSKCVCNSLLHMLMVLYKICVRRIVIDIACPHGDPHQHAKCVGSVRSRYAHLQLRYLYSIIQHNEIRKYLCNLYITVLYYIVYK